MVLEVSMAYHKLPESELALNTVEEIVHYYDLYQRTLNEDAYTQFIKYFNKYLEIMAPVKRIPGLANVVANIVTISLWDAGVEPDKLRNLLVNLLDLKYIGTRFEEVKFQLTELLKDLGTEPVVDQYVKTPEDALTFALLLLVISTNPY